MTSEYAEILGKHISEKTVAEIERIVGHIQHQVVFERLEDENGVRFGQADWITFPHWTVRSVTDIPQHAFEANLLHELYHLCQVVEGFPQTATKNFPGVSAAGSILTSVILDLDVCDRIERFGLSSEYFFNRRYQQAMSQTIRFEITNRDDFVSMAICIAGIILQNNERQAREVCQHYQARNPRLVRKTRGLASTIKRTGNSTPEECLKSLAASYDYLDIWDWQLINFQGYTFLSSEQVSTFLSESHLGC